MMTRSVLVLCATMFVAVAGDAVSAERADGIAAERAFLALKAVHPDVRIHKQETRITRLYGTPMAFGTSAVESAETFRLAHADVLGVSPEDLVPLGGLRGAPTGQPLLYVPATGQYKFQLFRYEQQRGGLPVYGADLRLVVRDAGDYPLVLAASTLRNIGDFSPQPAKLPASFDPATDAATGMERFSEQRTVIWAGTEKADAAPRVAVSFVGELGESRVGMYEKWRFVCDAQTGEILHQENLIVFQDVSGNVGGKATQGHKADQCSPEVPRPMPYAFVSISGGNSANADANGNFTIANGGTGAVTVNSYARGTYFRVYNTAGSDTSMAQSVSPPGPADFLHNSANTDEFLRAQINGYVHANEVRDWILTYDPSYPTISTQTDFSVNVNRNDGYCPGNAWYDGASINFCREDIGANASNTAFASVSQHEYGHHVVDRGGSGQGEYGEGMSDCVSMLVADDPGLGYGFFYDDCATPLRNADNTCQYSASSCSSCGSSIHSCGQLISGCVWSLRMNLAANYPSTYMDIVAPLTLASVQVHGGASILPSITTDFLTLDDDDGDLGNGTPHESEITAAFAAHNMVAGPPPANDACGNAPPICPRAAVSGSTGSATNDGSASCAASASSPDVWYAYTPATSGTATFSMCNGTSYDAALSVHTGCPGSSGNETGCDDDFCGSGGPAQVTQSVSGGTTYYVRVTGWSGSAGPYSLEVTGPDCASAATCSDGIQNQGEDRIDCGGPCAACNCISDAACDDALFCSGTETCDAFGNCQSGTAVNCDDGVGCTDDSCNDATSSCDNIANDGNCDDGLFCNGAETCDPIADCQGGMDPCPGIGCDEPTQSCVGAACADADINCDGTTDAGDILVIRGIGNWNLPAGSVTDPRADVDGNGTVDAGDILLIRGVAVWNTSTGPCVCP